MKIQLEIDCGEETCGSCGYLEIHTVSAGLFHPECTLFHNQYGKWGMHDMKRAKPCIAAQKAAERLVK